MNCPHSIILRSSLSEQPMLENFVDQVCEHYNIGNTYFGHILLSLTEAFQNAVIHGNRGNEAQSVRINLINTRRGLKFSVTDEGPGFNPDLVPDPTNPDVPETETSGRGIFTITTLADEVSFANDGRTINISFYVSSMNLELSKLRAKELGMYLSQKKIQINKE